MGAADPQGVSAFESWLGSGVAYEEDYLPFDSWQGVSSAGWWLRRWRGSGRTLVLGVPMLPTSGGTLARGAAGDYDGAFRRLAQELAADGEANAIIRLGWEFNGTWYPWAVRTDDDALAFAAYFRRVAATMRAVAPRLRFDWNPSIGVWPTFPLADAYPGNDAVDFIGLDVYDQSWAAGYRDAASRWRAFVGQRYGLAWQTAFARAHVKQVSFPEWGLAVRDDGHGGGDDPLFIDRMADRIAQPDVGYAVYFNYDASDGAHELDDTSFARSAVEFRRRFGGPGT